jgi:Hydrazine synthase alpha subunit middle domain
MLVLTRISLAVSLLAFLAACGGGGGGGADSSTNQLTSNNLPTTDGGGVDTGGTPPVVPTVPTVPVVPPVTVAYASQPQSQSIVVGGDAMFSAYATSTTSAAVKYKWLRDGQEIAGETGSRYILKGVKTTDSGAKISVVATNDTDTVTSSAATLTVTTAAQTSYPIMFVTSVPGTAFFHQLNTFANHGTDRISAVAGGDLYIRYTDGTLRNLTSEAGWGVGSSPVPCSTSVGRTIQGGDKAISVRQPSMHWDGKKALVSMLVGGPTGRYGVASRIWQIYEVTGLGKGEKVTITKVANQPAYNNISPIYGSDDNILFISDAPLFGMKTVYPQLDEYESSITNTGVWRLNVASGKVTQIQHAPSGVFDLFLDSYGRILFTKWDHLQRDQQADNDRFAGGVAGSKDFESETSTTVKVWPARDAAGKLIADSRGTLYDVFPGARISKDPTKISNENDFGINQFFIWQVNEDGSGEETINHLGRHEFGGAYQHPSFNDDANLTDSAGLSTIANAYMRGTIRSDAGVFQFREDPNRPGVYMGTYAYEFSRQAAGRIVEFRMPPGMNPEDIVVTDYTNKDLDADAFGSAAPTASMTGHYRNPLRLSNGSILVAHTPETRVNGFAEVQTDGSVINRLYKFKLKTLINNPFGTDKIAGPDLVGDLNKRVCYWTDDANPKEYNGQLSQHDAIEVRPRARPVSAKSETPDVEAGVLRAEGVNETELRNWLAARGLALIVSRNVTLRDRAETQQPFNLQVKTPDGAIGVKNTPASGKVYDISALQIFQGDMTRGYTGAGRRVYARPVHSNAQVSSIEKWYQDTPAKSSTVLGTDGSMAAFVPAGRALTWQLVDPVGKPVVRERVWVSFAPGEIRVCASCHGINKTTSNGLGEPENPPAALATLLRKWKLNK